MDEPRLRVLGEMELRDRHGMPVAVPGRRNRGLLAVLALTPGCAVPDERVFDALWPGDDGPRDPGATLRTYIMRLRRIVGTDLIVRDGAGYRLTVAPAEVDAHAFEHHVAAGCRSLAAGLPDEAGRALRAGLALWRGPPWQALEGWPAADAHAVRCVELHARAVEQAAACQLACGNTDAAVQELLALVELDPVREERWALLMTALAQADRPADALRAYQRARHHFRDALGLEPSARLRALEAAVLDHRPLALPGGTGRGRAPADSSPAPADDFVGRDAVLGRLRDLAEAGLGGGCPLVLVSGPAGVGKSRLCAELANRLADTTHLVRTGCWDGADAPPRWPWPEVLRRLDTTADCPVTGFAYFEHLAARLRLRATDRPVVVIIDDLQVADEDALLATRFLSTNLTGAPVLIVATVQTPTPPGPGGAVLEELGRIAVEVPLAGLDADAVARLVAAGGRPAEGEAIGVLHDLTRGNPRLVQMILQACDTGPLGAALPGAVREVVAGLLHGLDPEEAEVLARAAVLGPRAAAADLAAVGDLDPVLVDRALRAGRRVGLLHGTRPAVFTHELVRAALTESLSPAERHAVHAGAALALGRIDPTATVLLRAAGHALDAAPRSAADLRTALALASTAAGALIREDAHTDAEALLRRALAVARRTSGHAPVALLLDHSHTLNLTGRLDEAHRTCTEALDAAEHAGDPVGVAAAAAGLGSQWPVAVRDPVEQRRILRRQRDALVALPPGHDALALRLRSRIAMEEVFWEYAPTDGVLAIVEEVRHGHDPALRLDILAGVHSALLGPELSRVRLELAETMVADAAALPDGLRPLIARTWQMVDRFLAGEPLAGRSLAELARRAEDLPARSILYIARSLDVMLTIRSGAFDTAERQAAEAAALGAGVQETDAAAIHAAQVLTIRYFQGRDTEMLPALEALSHGCPELGVDRSFDAGLAAVAARAGRPDLAHQFLERLRGAGPLSGLPRLANRLPALLAVVEAAAALDDPVLARRAYDLLLPHADLPVMATLGLACFGSAHGPLGLAAATFGDVDAAARHLDAAVPANIRLGHHPATALARFRRDRLPGTLRPCGVA